MSNSMIMIRCIFAMALVAMVTCKDYYSSVGCSTPDCREYEVEEMNECQDLDNCPYSYDNTMSDYVAGSDVAITPELNEFMKTQIAIYLDLVATHYPPSKADAADVFQGLGGRAYIYLRLYDRTGDEAHLTTALAYMNNSLSNVDSIEKSYVGFLWGRTGVYTLSAVLADLHGLDQTAADMIARVQEIFDKSVDDSYAPYDDFDAGRAGLIFAASFLKSYFKKDVITRSSVVAVGEAVIRRGQQLSSNPSSYMEFNNPNDGGKWLGQSHGSAGVLCQLLDVPELLEEGTNSRDMIIGTLNHIVANQFPSGNFPSEYYDSSVDKLVQWDHGAPGVMGVLVKAANILSNSSYLDAAHLAADCTWERGLLYKGLMLCHGITGNTYMQIYMYKMTRDLKYMDRALSFQEFLSGMPELYDVDLMRKPTPYPFSFFTGSYEPAIMLWMDLIAVADSSNFDVLGMPGYDAFI